jgi:hypothetical protein
MKTREANGKPVGFLHPELHTDKQTINKDRRGVSEPLPVGEPARTQKQTMQHKPSQRRCGLP